MRHTTHLQERHHMNKLALSGLALLALAGSTYAAAQGIVVMPPGTAALGQARSAPDFRGAQSVLPMGVPLPATAFDINAAAAVGNRAPAAGQAGHPGMNLKADALARRLVEITPDDEVNDLMGLPRRGIDTAPNAVGTQGLHFTSSQVFPSQADTTYPTRATGKLWFQKVVGSASWFVCSASMVKPGIIATAGHC